MKEFTTHEESPAYKNAGEGPVPDGRRDLYRDLFLSNPSPIVLFDCATLQLTDLNDQARSLLALPPDGELPTLTGPLFFDDPEALADFCTGLHDAWTDLRAQLKGVAGKQPLLLRLKRLPAVHRSLAQAIISPEPGSSPDTCDGVYASIFAHAGIGLTVIDTSLRIRSMNPTIRSWFPQIDPEQHPYCYASFNSPPREAACSYCPAVRVLEDGKPHSATTSTPTPEGVRHYSMIASPVFAADGTVSSVIETAEDVTERMLLEQQMAEKSRTLQAVLDNAPIAIWYKDVAGRFRFVNKTFCRQMGIGEEEFLAAPHFSHLLPPEMSSICAASDQHCLDTDETHVSLERFPFSDGKPHLLSVTKANLKGEDGRTLGVIGLGIDVSEQQLYAERLKLLTDCFLRFGPDFDANINVLTEVAGRILGAECALFNMLDQGELRPVGQWRIPEGFEPSDRRVGHICYDFLSSGTPPPWIISDLAATTYAVNDANVLRLGLKTYLGVPVSWDDRTIGVLCAFFTRDFEPSPADLSFLLIVASALGIEEARRRSVRAQQSSEQRYRTLFSEAGEGVFLMSQRGVILEVNQAFAQMHGYSTAEMAGVHLSSLDTPETLALAPERMRRLMGGEHLTFEVEHYHRDGHTFQLEVSASVIGCDGEQNIICFHRDITERKQQEIALQKSEREFRLLADAMPQMVWICGADGRNLYTNDKWGAYTGLSREQSCNDGWEAIFHPDDLSSAWDAWRRAGEGEGTGEYGIEARLRGSDGEYRWWLVRGVPVRDESDRVLKWFGTCTDIDDLKRAEEERRILEKQFQQAQKLESLGVLAGGVAHDFNNILAIISGYCSLLEFEPERCADYLPEIASAADRAADLCRQMLAYAGKTHFAMGLVDLVVLVEEMVRMLRATLGRNVTIRTSRTMDDCFLLADASQIRQVVMNLVINAAEAIGESQGEIRVALGRCEVCAGDGEVDHLGKEVPPGTYGCLEVTDTGCGMDEQTRLRVFEPFFSTKFSGRGLGMSAVLGIINAHGGALQIDSVPDEGTRFRIYLPALEGASQGSPTSLPSPVPWQGSGTVLLVEDEPMVRGLASTMLKKLGFQVVEASHGREGLERYRQQQDGFRFVVTDLGMPVMDGYQMFYELKRMAPGLPIVITTGFGDLDVSSRIPPEQIAGFVAKPYNFVQLKDLVRRLVEGG